MWSIKGAPLLPRSSLRSSRSSGRATLVGQSTFGKNTVQQRFGLSNGGALKLTIARWVTPGGLDFGGVGVTPDVERDLEPDLSVAGVVSEALTASLAVNGARSG